MKDNSATVVNSGNVTATKSHESGIDEEGKKYLFAVLSNQYSNKEKAVLREYTTNAWDSHVVDGNTNPIDVTLPTLLQPTLLIQDRGTGLTQDEVLTLLGDYGASTKRSDNDTVGKMGIGSKSAITLVSQYVVTAVKDGLKNVVLFGLNDNGILEGKVVMGDVATEEPNGVLISLGVEDVESMNREADLYFSKWATGNVLVNGEQPECVWDLETTTKINDGAYVLPDHDGGLYVMMGQVSYEVSRDTLRKVQARFAEDTSAHAVAGQLFNAYEDSAVFLHVEIGDVEIAPSRESVMDSFSTITSIAAAIQAIADSLTTHVQAQIDAEPNAYAAVQKFEEIRDAMKPLKVGRKSVSYKGLRLREVQSIDMPAVFVTRDWGKRNGPEVIALAKDYELESRKAANVVVVQIPAGKEGSVKRYAKRFLDDQGLSAILLAIDTDAASYGWFTYGGDTGGAKVLTLDEYRAICKELRESDPRARTEPGYTTGWRSAQTYDRDLLSDITSLGKDIIAYQGTAHGDEDTKAALEDYTVVVLTRQQSMGTFRQRVLKDGSVRVLEPSERDKIVADYVAAKFAVTPEEAEALGAKAWLNGVLQYSLRDITKGEQVVKVLGEENITSRAFLDAVDTVSLARLTHSQVDNDRLREIENQATHLGLKTEDYAVAFEADYTDVTVTYPMLAHIDNYELTRRGSDEARAALHADVLSYINAR